MEIGAAVLFNGSIGMVIGALMIARRDECARAFAGVCRTPPRWSALLAGVIAGSGLSMLLAAAWTIHSVVAALD